jgi:hypothetical protein
MWKKQLNLGNLVQVFLAENFKHSVWDISLATFAYLLPG